MDRSGANEDTYPMLVISRLITVTYLPILPEWEEAQPKNLHVVSCEISIYCTVVAIWNQFWSITISSAASEPSSVFSPKPCRRHYFDFPELFRRTMSPMYMGYFIKTTSPNYF